MKIKVLGTGGALEELPTAYIIEENILVDCGLEIVKKIIKSKEIDSIDTICITHLHMDHISGFELFVFYKLFKNETFKVFAGPDFLNFYKILKCSIESFSGKYIQPFEFTEINQTFYKINKEINLNVTNVKHCGGVIPAFAFTFVKGDDPFKSSKIIISGDTDSPLPISNTMLKNNNMICFHDMGWQGLENLNVPKVHCTEQEVYNIVGPSERLLAIHCKKDSIFKYYEKAEEDQVYYI